MLLHVLPGSTSSASIKYDSLGYAGKIISHQGLKSESGNPKSNNEIMVQETNTLNSILNLV
jgi:hypothetical protein